MSDCRGDVMGLGAARVQFIIDLIAELGVSRAGQIRTLYKEAHDADISGDMVYWIGQHFKGRIAKARKAAAEDYQSHELYSKRKLLNVWNRVIELGLEIETFGSRKQKVTEVIEGEDGIEEVTREVDVPMTKPGDLRAVVQATKQVLELIEFDERPAGQGRKLTKTDEKENEAERALSGLSVVGGRG